MSASVPLADGMGHQQKDTCLQRAYGLHRECRLSKRWTYRVKSAPTGTSHTQGEHFKGTQLASGNQKGRLENNEGRRVGRWHQARTSPRPEGKETSARDQDGTLNSKAQRGVHPDWLPCRHCTSTIARPRGARHHSAARVPYRDPRSQTALMRSCLKKLSVEALTLIRQEVQHGLQQEGQVPDRQGRIPHPPGGVDQLVKQAHLHSGPASVRACHQSHTESQVRDEQQDGPGTDMSV